MNLPYVELKRQKRGLCLTYGLTAVENFFALLYPFAIGVAINGLIAGRHELLLPLVVIWLAHTAIGYWRQRFDTRLFTRIYAAVATSLAVNQRKEAVSTSEIAARTDMVEELVEFMEEVVPEAILALFALAGGVAMLFWYDAGAALIMTAILPPTAWVYWRFARRARLLEGRFNDEAEDEVDLIDSGSEKQLQQHFKALSRHRVGVSDAEANTWSVVEVLALVAFLAVLLRLTQAPTLPVGDIVAAVAYAIRVVEGLDALPSAISGVSRMVDNLSRLNTADQ